MKERFVLVIEDDVSTKHVAIPGKGMALCGSYYSRVWTVGYFYVRQIDCKRCREELASLTKGVE
jgi:hypothetical protein